MKAKTVDWIKGLNHPCSNIYVTYGEKQKVVFLMKFSLVTGGFPRDIEITFDQPISFILEDESYSSVELPDELPHCQGDYSNYTYPILEIESSKWSEQYSALSLAYNDCEPKQYALLSWYETVLVLSTDKPKVKLVNAYT